MTEQIAERATNTIYYINFSNLIVRIFRFVFVISPYESIGML